ncbi:hypothetical protein [Flavobacterium taihuense]|uniref:Uncharacterized protein n=1 Tax=Flavobacterium taihuense TaxID=2857508 RepID=A0ABS6Y095_9FLAO|nr:hypothetical protein [Flavobacterium taihuense]MBW4362345.1 hypothetical protein [Flavobacterium taihuense]
MKKIITTITVLLLFITATQAQTQFFEKYDYERNSAYNSTLSTDYSTARRENRPKTITIEQGQGIESTVMDTVMVKSFVYHPSISKNGKKINYLTWDELNQEQKDEYTTTIRKQRKRKIFVQDSIQKAEQNNLLVIQLAEQQRIKKLEEDNKRKKDSLNLVEKNLNVNQWGVEVGSMRTEEFTFSPITLKTLVRAAKLNPDFYGDLMMLSVENDNVDYNKMDESGKGEWYNITTIDPKLVFVTVKISRNLSLIKLVKSGALFIIKEQYLNYCTDMFNCLNTTLAQYKTIDVTQKYTTEEIAILNRYKKVLSSGSPCTTTIATIRNRKQYDFVNRYGQHFFDSDKVTPIDKQNHNNSIKKIWKLDEEWKTIREDETLLNGNNKIMEKLLEDDKYLQIKVRMEDMYSNSLI